MPETVLVTGGAGYIGSHTCVELLAAGHRVIAVDNLSNSSPVAVERVRELSGGEIQFHQLELRDGSGLDRIFRETPIDSVVHFAGLKAVAESVEIPLEYYDNNLVGTINLLRTMKTHNVRRLVFSSSCTVYGAPDRVPITEDAPLRAINPYGRTKLYIEELCRDVATGDAGWHIILLRYFNPVGAHESGRIGEDPAGIPNNLMPFVMQTAIGRHDRVRVFGGDYDTPDGTCIRDYIHVVDLAVGHLAALDKLDAVAGCLPINLGTGRGYSVLDVLAAASKGVGRELPYEIVGRRPGDAPCVYADPTLAASFLGWRATRDLAEMCRDHWAWQQHNPDGYR